MHSVDVEEFRLPWPLLAEGQFVVCVISARFSLAKNSKVAEVNCSCTNSP